MSKQGVFSGPYSVQVREITDQKLLRIWTHFTQWEAEHNEDQGNFCVSKVLPSYCLSRMKKKYSSNSIISFEICFTQIILTE